MIIVAVTNDYSIDDGDVLDLARLLRIALGEEERKGVWRATVLEDGVIEDA
jgi:hypothetical protein